MRDFSQIIFKWNLRCSWKYAINKPPDNDGLSKEFYVCFFDTIGSILMENLNYAFVKGELSSSQRQAVITLIEEKGRDKRYLKN